MNTVTVRSQLVSAAGDPPFCGLGGTGGPWRRDVWVGDFPPDPLNPFPQIQPYVPIPQTIYPIGPAPLMQPIDFSKANLSPVSPWRVKLTSNSMVASVDMPGVKLEDVEVTIDDGVLRASGKRSDTGAVTKAELEVGSVFDPSTAEATLVDGVLAVEIQRIPERKPRRVPVSAK